MPFASTRTRCDRWRPATRRWSRAGGAGNAPNQLIELFPDTATVEEGELAVGGVRASALAEEYGTPLVVYCRETVLARARAYARVDPEALVVYGTKAFPNVALLRRLAAEGVGADVSTLGEIESETHHAIRTAHAESKFGLVADDAIAAVEDAGAAGLDVLGLHVHIGSQLVRTSESLLAVERLVDVAEH